MTTKTKRKKPTQCHWCAEAGVKSKRGDSVKVVFDPGIQMPGTPTIEGHRLAAEQMAGLLYNHGVKEITSGWPYLTHEEIIVACWWAGLWGPRRYQKAWKEWATMAGGHLWYGCVNVPFPPTAAEIQAAALPVVEEAEK